MRIREPMSREDARDRILAKLREHMEAGALVAIAVLNPHTATLHEFHIMSNIKEPGMMADVFRCAGAIVTDDEADVEGYVCDA